MKPARTLGWTCLCTVAALTALAGCANSTNKNTSHDGMPDMKAMESAWKESSTPGPMHQLLTERVGAWDGKCKSWMDPSQPPEESTCTMTISSSMGGRFTRGDFQGSMKDFSGNPMQFEGFGIYGFNNTTKKYECTWCDSMGTMMQNYTGKASSDRHMLTWETRYVCPFQHKETWMRLQEKMTGPNTMVMEMYGPDMNSGKTYKMMQIDFTRRTSGSPYGR